MSAAAYLVKATLTFNSVALTEEEARKFAEAMGSMYSNIQYAPKPQVSWGITPLEVVAK